MDPTPKFATISRWCDISGMSRTSSYREFGNGNLKTIKCGDRTLVDVEAGLAWLRSLPPAEIRAPKAT